MTDKILWDEYQCSAGLSGIQKYIRQHDIRKTSKEVREVILESIYENTAGGVNSSQYIEAKKLLQL